VDANDDVPKPDRVSKRFKFYVRKAKLSGREELSFHSCRHTTGSWLSMQGVPLRVISEILGHSNTQVTEMYSHLSPEVMDRAMEETFGGSWAVGERSPIILPQLFDLMRYIAIRRKIGETVPNRKPRLNRRLRTLKRGFKVPEMGFVWSAISEKPRELSGYRPL